MQTKVLKKGYNVRYNNCTMTKDSAKITQFCQKIGITNEDTKTILDFNITPFRYHFYCFVFKLSPVLLRKIINRKKQRRALFLEFFLRYAVDNEAFYLAFFDGDTEAYYRQFRDIAIWLDDCKTKFGIVGIDEDNWVVNMLTLYVVRFGRLQYETKPYAHQYTPQLRQHLKGKALHTIHIPKDGSLDVSAVKASLMQASSHFGVDTFFCRSWLLSPDLLPLLPPTSNIRYFSSLFVPMGSVDSRQAEEYLFFALEDDPTQYIANTTLQKNVKNHLVKGGVISEGMGIVDVKTL